MTDKDDNKLARLVQYIKQDWNHMHDYIITKLGNRALALRTKTLVTHEEPKLLTLREHHNVVLFSVNGTHAGRDRPIGYVLVYGGAPTLHWNTRYTSISYTELTDIRSREVGVIYNDPDVRLLRFGVGVFDYLLVCLKQTDEQLQVDVADHAIRTEFDGTYKDGS